MRSHPSLIRVVGAGLLCASVTACAPLDRVDLAWNALFEVQTALRGEGCEGPTDAGEPIAPLVGIGLAGIDDVMSVYWCTDTETCAPAPWATAWLDVALEDRVEGEHGTVSLTGGQLCQVSWAGISATQDEAGLLTLQTHTFTSTPLTVSSGAECDELLRALIGETCDETWAIEAVRLP